jgi:hypothetical protein
VKRFAVLFVFLTLCFALLGSQHQERIQRTRNFPAVGRIEHSRQGEPMRFAMIWEGQPNSNVPYSITATSDGGYLINATTWSFAEGSSDLWLIKMDSNFEMEWQKTYGGEKSDCYGYCTAHETPDHGFLVFTDTNSFGFYFYDFWILKLSPTGEIEWQRTYGTREYDTADGDMQPTKDGGYIAIGSTEHPSTRKYDFWILKLDRYGQIEWERSYGEPDAYELGYSIQETNDGGFIAGGSQMPPGSAYYRPLLLKISASGEIQWQKALGENERKDFFFPHVREASDGGYILEDTSLSAGAGGSDLWVVKLSPSGNVQWQKLYGGSQTEWGRDLCPTSDGGCLVAAATESYGAGSADFWLLKLDSRGNIEWQKTYGTGKFECTIDIIATDEGDYIVTGYSSVPTSLGSKFEMMIIKIAPNGEIGPCSLVQNTNATVSLAPMASAATHCVSLVKEVIIQDTPVVPGSTDEHPILLCSNLHQPPTNISIRREMNRSLFVKEYYDHLSWEPDSWNDRFNIAEYRIYRKTASGQTYQLVASVGSDIFSYMDGPVDSSEDYQYALTSVDSEGRESPRSLPVKAS